jgi:uncharacterized membrane protein YtjA (UPF0391 family)
MLHYALVFFVIALIAGLLGFGVVASAAGGIAKMLCFVFLVLFVVALIPAEQKPFSMKSQPNLQIAESTQNGPTP